MIRKVDFIYEWKYKDRQSPNKNRVGPRAQDEKRLESLRKQQWA